MSTATAEAQAATLAKFIEGWKTFTPESWTETWTDDCTQNFLPFTMGVPPRTKPEVLKLLPSLLGVLLNYKVPKPRVSFLKFCIFVESPGLTLMMIVGHIFNPS